MVPTLTVPAEVDSAVSVPCQLDLSAPSATPPLGADARAAVLQDNLIIFMVYVY